MRHPDIVMQLLDMPVPLYDTSLRLYERLVQRPILIMQLSGTALQLQAIAMQLYDGTLRLQDTPLQLYETPLQLYDAPCGGMKAIAPGPLPDTGVLPVCRHPAFGSVPLCAEFSTPSPCGPRVLDRSSGVTCTLD